MREKDKLRSETQYIVTVSVPRASLIRPFELYNFFNRVEKNIRNGLNDLVNDYNIEDYKVKYNHTKKVADVFIKTSVLDRKVTPKVVEDYINRYFKGFWFGWNWTGEVRFKSAEKIKENKFEEVEENIEDGGNVLDELQESGKIVFYIILLIAILYALNTVRGAVS